MEKHKIKIGDEVSIHFNHEEIEKIGIIHGIPMTELADLRITIDNEKYKFQYLTKYHHYEKFSYGEMCEGFLIKKGSVNDVKIKLLNPQQNSKGRIV